GRKGVWSGDKVPFPIPTPHSPLPTPYCLGVWSVARFSDLSVRNKKTAPFSTFTFLPVSERVELPLASALEVEVMAISPLAFAVAPFAVAFTWLVPCPVASPPPPTAPVVAPTPPPTVLFTVPVTPPSNPPPDPPEAVVLGLAAPPALAPAPPPAPEDAPMSSI